MTCPACGLRNHEVCKVLGHTYPLENSIMPADRKKAWIEKYGDCKAVKEWLAANPPPAEWQGTPAEYAYEEGPIDVPLDVPDGDEDELEVPVTRREHDALREQVARVAKGFNRAIRKRRTAPPPDPPTPPAPPPDPPTPPAKRTGVAAILEPLARRR